MSSTIKEGDRTGWRWMLMILFKTKVHIWYKIWDCAHDTPRMKGGKSFVGPGRIS